MDERGERNTHKHFKSICELKHIERWQLSRLESCNPRKPRIIRGETLIRK